MFKDINSLISIEIFSNKNLSILSMISTFENCQNLKTFKINGANTNKVKSMKKLFYKTGLTEFPLNELNIENLEDMSFTFAYTEIEI